MAQMTHGEWLSWLSNLKTGDRVAVVDCFRGVPEPTARVIYTATVRRTPSGRLYLDERREDWQKGRRDDPGAGARAIMPIPI